MPNNSRRRCSSWLYIQTCLALHSSDWKNRRCNPPWRFLLLYEPKSVSHTFPSVYIHLINTADKTVQHQLSATMPGQRYKDELVVVFFFFFIFTPSTNTSMLTPRCDLYIQQEWHQVVTPWLLQTGWKLWGVTVLSPLLNRVGLWEETGWLSSSGAVYAAGVLCSLKRSLQTKSRADKNNFSPCLHVLGRRKMSYVFICSWFLLRKGLSI